MTLVCCAVLTGQKAALAREIARRKEGVHLCLRIFITSPWPLAMLFCLLLVCATPLARQRLAALALVCLAMALPMP